MGLWSLVLIVLASSLATVGAVTPTTTTTYTLIGYVHQPGGASAPPVPAGVQVDLVSRGTGTVYTTSVTGKGGQFTFTSTSSASTLAPGYWELYVPSETNVTLSGCKPLCAILPVNQNPSYQFFNFTQLTNSTLYPTIISNVTVLPYNATQNGTVMGTAPVPGANVRLLAPTFGGAVLANTTTNATGNFSFAVPFGTWLLQSSHTSGPNTYTNTSQITISSVTPPIVHPVLRAYSISGYMTTPTGYVPTTGNATLYEPATKYAYAEATPAGGFYSLTPYPAGFTSGANSFDVVLAAAGYQTSWYTQAVSGPGALHKNVLMATVPTSSLGVVATTLNLTTFNVTTGKGTLGVLTTATLGNDSVIGALPNATVGQLWAQLGLDFNHTLTVPAADLASDLEPWLASSGPFFPAVQAGTTINGTGFYGPNGTIALSSFSSTCALYCGLTSAASLSYSWNVAYTLNGTAPKNSSTYSLAFAFQHPTTANVLYNYTLELPSGYQLAAGTTVPSHTTLTPNGPDGTWTTFTLSSKPSSTAAATATFQLVKYANLTVNVNVSSSNFTFSDANILNSTHGNYTVVAGQGENLSFSALNSTYPAGTNGTKFVWNWGDATNATTSTNGTASHIYSTARTQPYNGTVVVTSSGGLTNSTNFSIYVENSVPTAGIVSNATTNQTFNTTHHVEYLNVNWSTTLQFNATGSSVASPNNLSIASFTLVAHGYKNTANFTRASGGDPRANWTVQFLGAGLYLQNGNVSGELVSIPNGWQYNLTLTVWTFSGSSATTTLVILVNDTQPPTPSFKMLNAAGNAVSSSGLVAQANGSALVRLNGGASTDPNNGSITNYFWHINTTANTSFNIYTNVSKASPYPAFWLPAQPKPYIVNLTVTDLNGNTANTTQSLAVSINSTTTPVLSSTNLTGPGSFTQGKSTTVWVNVTVTQGSKAVATDVQVAFYLLSSSGTGSRAYIGSSPESVTFYSYASKGVINPTPIATGTLATLGYNKTVRAVLTWTPSQTGSFILYANATATNQYAPDVGGSNVASMSISIHPNPTTQLLEYGGVGAGVIIVIVALVWWYRRPRSKAPSGGKGSGSSSSKSGLERAPKRDADEDDDN